MEKEPASFLSLPTELRIMIYSYAMDEDIKKNFPYQAIVEDLAPREYRVEKRRGLLVHQSAYQPIHQQDVPCPLQCQPNFICKSSSSMTTTSYKVTHMVLPKTSYGVPGLLGVCRLVRSEALSVFYLKSTIEFRSMTAVMPFLNDRPDYIPYFRSFRFCLNLDWHGHTSPAHQQWIQVFNCLAKGMPSLGLQHLSVTVIDPNRYCLDRSLHTRRLMHWIHALAEIRELESVQTRFELNSRRNPGSQASIFGAQRNWDKVQCERKLHGHLRPLMLKPTRAQTAVEFTTREVYVEPLALQF